MSGRRRAALVVAALLVAAVGAGAWALWPRGTDEVTKAEALDRFRDGQPTTTSEGVRSEPAERSSPPAGVYTYGATGQEQVKLGPLPAETRPLPATITAIVADEASDCFKITFNLFAQHTEDTTYCTGADGLRLDRHVKHQQIGALSPTATMTCDPGVVLPNRSTTADLRCELTLEGGPVPVQTELTGTVAVAPQESRTVGGVPVATTPLTISFQVSGSISGSWTERIWLRSDNLPVRVERNLDLVGPATFHEQTTFDLVDLEPET